MRRYLLLVPLVFLAVGCPVTQRQDTPWSALRKVEAQTKAKYWLYVPSYYSDDEPSGFNASTEAPDAKGRARGSRYSSARCWPLVVTLHGTHGWDNSRRQIMEWKYLAEQKGLIVVAPVLKSVQGILPVRRDTWYRDLKKDEKTILAVIDEVTAQYRVDPNAVLLTGFSAGGYPMYYVALRHPELFSMVIARACNSSLELFERIELTGRARQLPIRIFWGKDDLKPIGSQSWDAVRWLGEHGFKRMNYRKIRGGHLRRPEVAYRFWREVLPERYRK